MGLLDRRRRCVADADFRFGWVPSGGYPASSPSVSVAWSGGAQTYALAAVRAADSVSALSADGYDLTITTGPEQPSSTLRGIIAEWGGYAWLDGGAEFQGPVRVLQLVSQTSLAATTSGTAVLRLATALPGGLSIVSAQSSATGSIVLSAGFVAAASPGALVRIAGVAIESDELGGAAPGYSGALVDLESSPGVRCSDATFASRLAACIDALGLGVDASAASLTVTLTAGHNVTVVEEVDGGAAALIAVTSPTGASARWSLRWLGYTALIPAADVGAAVARSIKWSIAWSCKTGADLPTYGRTDRGLLDVVMVPFDTGLTDEHLYALVPGWRSVVPQGQTSWQAQRDAALDELEDMIRPLLGPGEFVDQLLAEQFRPVHALLAAARILQGLEALGIAPGFVTNTALDRYREDAAKALDACLSRKIWIDVNDDGEVSSDELGTDSTAQGLGALSNVFDSDYSDGRPTGVRHWDDR